MNEEDAHVLWRNEAAHYAWRYHALVEAGLPADVAGQMIVAVYALGTEKALGLMEISDED